MEQVIDPEVKIVDAHHHLWDMTIETGLEKRYMLHEILSEIEKSGHNVLATVFVECGAFYNVDLPEAEKYLGEVEFCQGLAAQSESDRYGPVRICAGIIGRVDIMSTKAEATLKKMMAVRNFRGVRLRPHREEVFNLEDTTLHQNLTFLEQNNLVLDYWTRDFQLLPKFEAMAKAFPKLTIVLDHLGGAVGPKMSEDEFEKWKLDVRNIAQKCSNVYAKIGGIQMIVNGWDFHERKSPISSIELCEHTMPFYSHMIKTFGPDRCMFESNFPVDKPSVNYNVLWNTFKRIAKKLNLSSTERDAIFAKTAIKVYKLKLPAKKTRL